MTKSSKHYVAERRKGKEMGNRGKGNKARTASPFPLFTFLLVEFVLDLLRFPLILFVGSRSNNPCQVNTPQLMKRPLS